MKDQYDGHQRAVDIEPGDLVLVHDPTRVGKLTVPWTGPHRVVGRQSEVDFVVRHLKSGKESVIHAQRLKRYVPWSARVSVQRDGKVPDDDLDKLPLAATRTSHDSREGGDVAGPPTRSSWLSLGSPRRHERMRFQGGGPIRKAGDDGHFTGDFTHSVSS